MAYEKQNFTNGQILTAEHLNNIEAGIVANEEAIAEKQPKGNYLTEHQKIKTINGQSMVGDGNIEVGGATDEQISDAVTAYLTENEDALDVTGGQYSVIKNDNYAVAVCDSNGNIAVAVDNDGKVRVANLEASNLGSNESSNTDCWLKGKHCYVLGDSLSADTSAKGSWHQKFCELTGAILDADANRGWFSIGGTATIGTHTEQNACCQMRAKRLVEHYNEGNPVDVIFIQNVNDINNNRFSAGINTKGTNADLPFFENQVIVYNEAVIETSEPSTDVVKHFKDNLGTIINGVTPITGTVIEMLYTNGGTNAKELAINSAPTADGNITLTFKYGAAYRDEKYNIAVRKGMSVSDVVSAILEWNYADVGKYDDVEGKNGNSVVFSSPYSLTFDGGATGVTATVTDTAAINRYPMAFNSLDVSAFSDASKWVGEAAISYWSAQKGLIEYLQKNIPNAKIFYLILPYYKVTYPATSGSAYLRPDGSFNMEYWDSNGRGGKSAQNLYAEQPLVANYYGCGYIDVVNNCSISPVNIQTYYPSNDVHPTTEGYNAWGETVARLLAGK